MTARCDFNIGWPVTDVPCRRVVHHRYARMNGRYGGFTLDGEPRCWEHLFEFSGPQEREQR